MTRTPSAGRPPRSTRLSTETAPAPDAHHGVVFWIGLLIGTAMIAYGLWGLFDNEFTTRPTNLGRWAVALVIFHDLILAPAAFFVVAVGKRVRLLASPYVRAAIATSALSAVVTWPLIRGYGKLRDNPTVLPLDYGANLIGTLAVVWTVALAATVLSHRRSRRRVRP